jgi:type II secretory pathway component PulF
VLAVLMVAVFLFLHGYVAVEMKQVFRDFDCALPPITRVFLWFSGSKAWLSAGLVVGLGVTVGALFAAPGLAAVQRWLYQVPLFGPLCRWNRLARFSRLMTLLLDQKLPLPDALRLTAAGLRSADMAEGCRRAADCVEAGESPSASLAAQWQFPASLIPFAEWGERTNMLGDAFRTTAEMFEDRVRDQCNLMETALLPVTFLFVTFFVLFFYASAMMPLTGLIQKLT